MSYVLFLKLDVMGGSSGEMKVGEILPLGLLRVKCLDSSTISELKNDGGGFDDCFYCDFSKANICRAGLNAICGECSALRRKDSKSVILKN